MRDVELDLKKAKSQSDMGRARQRKLKRQATDVVKEQEVKPASQRRKARQVKAETGHSSREHEVEAKIKGNPTPTPRIQDKLISKPMEGMQKISKTHVAQALNSAAGALTRQPRRKETKPSQNLYQKSAYTETQRRTESQVGNLPKTTRRVYDARSDAAPPVMVRGGLGGMAFGRAASSKLSKRKSPKRRIDVPLNVPGAELRLPSIPLLHIGWRAVSFLMVLMMVASLVLIWKSPVFKVTSLKTEGLQRLTLSDLNAVVRIRGSSIFTVSPNEIDTALEQAFPELSKVSVKVDLPSKVSIEVNERQPVIAWIQDDKEVWVDAEGVSFPARGTISDTLIRVEGYGNPPGAVDTGPVVQVQTATGEVAVTNTLTPTLKLSPELVSAILSLGAQMPPDTLLVYDSEHGLGWNDPKGWDVFFGSSDQDMEMKLTVYQSLVERLESQGIQPALISVEYVHAPYYRMER